MSKCNIQNIEDFHFSKERFLPRPNTTLKDSNFIRIILITNTYHQKILAFVNSIDNHFLACRYLIFQSFLSKYDIITQSSGKRSIDPHNLIGEDRNGNFVSKCPPIKLVRVILWILGIFVAFGWLLNWAMGSIHRYQKGRSCNIRIVSIFWPNNFCRSESGNLIHRCFNLVPYCFVRPVCSPFQRGLGWIRLKPIERPQKFNQSFVTCINNLCFRNACTLQIFK